MRTLRFSLTAATLAVFSALPLQAQPEAPPAKRAATPAKAPIINAEAKSLVEAMIANYKGLKSYSDQTAVKIEGTGLPKQLTAQFPVEATLAWERPSNFRFEGTIDAKKFLALSDATAMRAISPQHPNLWLEHSMAPQFQTVQVDGKPVQIPTGRADQRLAAAVFEADATSFGVAFMTEGDKFWGRTLKDVTILALEPDAEVEGTPCRVVNVQADDDDGSSSLIRLWLGKDDKLIRRIELTSDGGGFNSKIVETHSQVRANPALPASTWAFAPPEGFKQVKEFPIEDPHKYDPTIKVGDALRTFSGDDLAGTPLELNAKDGKVTVLCFIHITRDKYQADRLQRLHEALSAKGLHLVVVAGEGRRDRVEAFVREHKLTFPVFFEEAAMNNRLAGLFGVRMWSTAFVFNRQGKLAGITNGTNDSRFIEEMQKLFPDAKIQQTMDGDVPPPLDFAPTG